MGNTYGRLFRVTTWGESHGPAIGAVIDGCPAGVALDAAALQPDLDRRAPGQSLLSSQRRETDRVQILSGVHAGRTLGTPICLLIPNEDQRSRDYDELAAAYRPSHADYTYDAKYGHRDPRGGGRASARETGARVAAGALARLLLRERYGVELLAWVAAAGPVALAAAPTAVTRAAIEATPVRCPDPAVAAAMIAAIDAARRDGDSLGGIVAGVARGCPPGWGEPVFDRLEAELGKAFLSIPACKGVEFGSGFAGAATRGSAHNDPFFADADGRIRTRTNHSGGVQGGISNGAELQFRAAFKPTATILRGQETVTTAGVPTVVHGRGRHDPCVVPRAAPIVEAMAALVLIDAALLHEARRPRP